MYICNLYLSLSIYIYIYITSLTPSRPKACSGAPSRDKREYISSIMIQFNVTIMF